MIFDTQEYKILLNLPDNLDISFNHITPHDIFDIESYINNLKIHNASSLIVLWGIGHRISVSDQRITRLNEFYYNNSNPMLLVQGGVGTPSLLKFPEIQFSAFQYISGVSQQHSRPYVTNKTKKYWYASTKDYPTRRFLLQILLKEFADQGYIAYKCLTSYMKNFYSEEIKSNCLSIEDLLPITGFDTIADYEKIPEHVTQDSYLCLVTDTYFEGPVFLSEKTFNAMMFNQFFIYLGPQHSLKYLQEIGFKTFGHVIDESYDNISDPEKRLLAVSNSLRKFLQKPLDEIKNLYQKNLDIFEHNRILVEHFDINNILVPAMLDAVEQKYHTENSVKLIL